MTAPQPRLFLVAPIAPMARIADCLAAACEAGDVASLVLPAQFGKEIVQMAQAEGVAVLIDGDSARAAKLGADGVHIEASAEAYEEARRILGKNGIVGAWCGTSRHLAMEMAEAGADYLAFAQSPPAAGEPILAWSTDMLELPAVAFDPLEPEAIAALLDQRPDFIRPSDAMWTSPDAARKMVAATMLAIGGAR